MAFTALKLAFVKATRPKLEGVELEAAINAVSDADVVAFALGNIEAVKRFEGEVVKEVIKSL